MDLPSQLLDAAYADLGLGEGALLNAVDRPDAVSAADWVERGEWLSLASTVGVEKVFFVENNPVIVFASSEETDDRLTREAINRIWCMARPQCLFFARPGELTVLDLTRPPIGSTEAISDHQRILATVGRAAEVQSQLADFRRELIEAGVPTEGQGYFSAGESRADKALIQDLHKVRRELISAGLSGEHERHANALIGRAIFIRYLEDRGILRSSDFQDVASDNKGWSRLLSADQGVSLEPSMKHVNFTKVLGSKEFTYAFFDRIGSDFNGDLFPVTREERGAVTARHLRLLQRFLRGEIANDIPRLFFFAYRFEVVPIGLISSIYEAFYNAERGTDQNQEAHYTPIELVEYLLSKSLTREVLEESPSILDPACGSGVFLVEAFRRIVRFRQAKNRRKLSLPELKKILRDQLRGIDINGEAVRVAAFSLYLALLHHVEPPDIWRDKRLPGLTYEPSADPDDPNRFNILLADNSFSVPDSVKNEDVAKRFGPGQVDVIVGNPPWGFPKPVDKWGMQNAKIALKWCKDGGHQVGDQELSQAFIHRALNFLRPRGRAALLVSSGVFFKQHECSRCFRRQWLAVAKLIHVVNFSAVRHLFFSSAIAPFASVVFVKEDGLDPTHNVEYWSAKNTLQVQRMNAVVLSLADRRVFRQVDALADERLWKVYWWGNHHDYALIRALECHPSLGERVGDTIFGSGFKEDRKGTSPSGWLKRFREFPTSAFRRYGPLPQDKFLDTPARVSRARTPGLYEGKRLLLKRGITQSGGQDGVIEARLETEPFAFRHSIYGINLDALYDWQAKVLLGILWSSLAQYYFWMTVGSWGTWHHEIYLEDVKRLPIALPEGASLQQRIVRVVDRLRTLRPAEGTPLLEKSTKGKPVTPQVEISSLERELDDLVFETYGLAGFERRLVNDMCGLGLDLFYRHAQGTAVKPLEVPPDFLGGRARDIGISEDNGISVYLRTFISLWNQQLTPPDEFVWRVIRPGQRAPMIAVVLETTDANEPRSQFDADAIGNQWDTVMQKLDQASVQHAGSRRIFIDGVVRIVTETEIIIVKRNERRLWTASMAREDAEATIRRAIELAEQQ